MGLGAGRRAGVGEARRAAAGAAAAGKISAATSLGRRRKDSAGEGEGREAGLKQEERDRETTRARSRETYGLSWKMAPGSRDPRRPLSRLRLRPRKAERVWSDGKEVTCLGCAGSRGQVRPTSVPPRAGSGEWFSVMGVVPGSLRRKLASLFAQPRLRKRFSTGNGLGVMAGALCPTGRQMAAGRSESEPA